MPSPLCNRWLSLSNLFQQVVWVALLQARPQDMPAGQSPLLVAIAINWVSYVTAIASTAPISRSLMLAASDIALSGLCLYATVSVMQKKSRFQQAFTAFMGGTAVLNMVAIPLFWLSAGSDSGILGMVNMVIIFWGLAIVAHVLRHTLEISQLLSIGLAWAFFVVVLNLLAIMGMIGEPTTTEQQLSIYQSLSAHWLSKA